MNFEDVREFQKEHQELVALIGALLVSLKSLNGVIVENVDLASVRRLQPVVSGFISKAGEMNKFFTKYHYPTYHKAIFRPPSYIATLLGNQTLPSKQLTADEFKKQLNIQIESLSEVMIATAQIVSPSIDANVKANNPFSAYCFLASMMDSISEEIVIVDPYIDQSIFYRYLSRLSKNVKIKIVSDIDKLKGTKLSKFESVENLFKTEYPNYTRELKSSLHDRYLINETNAYTLGGSIKDAAKKSDYSIVQLSDEKRLEIRLIYA
jgi:hypothetical protein